MRRSVLKGDILRIFFRAFEDNKWMGLLERGEWKDETEPF